MKSNTCRKITPAEYRMNLYTEYQTYALKNRLIVAANFAVYLPICHIDNTATALEWL